MATPTQIRAIDPFAEYNSNANNKITRILSNTTNCIIASDPIITTELSTTSLTIGSGSCIKDDVYINISETTLDLTDSDNYVDDTDIFNVVDGIYFIVLDYTYSKIKPAPEATIKIIGPSTRGSLFNTDDYILLKVAVSSSNVLSDLIDFDPDDTSIYTVISNTNPNRIVDVTSTYTISFADDIILANTSDVYLHPATMKAKHTIVNTRTSGIVTIHINTYTSDTIDNSFDNIILSTQYDSATLVSDGSSVWIEI